MSFTSNILITGTTSGLGKYLYNNLGGICWNRQTPEEEKRSIKKQGVKIIIHCAFNSDKNPKNLDQYLKDNVLLTDELTKISHHKFIFISSVDVYPKNSTKHSEDEVININEIDNLYGITKFMSENLVQKNCSNFLILRCTALLGKDSRKNSLIKILKDEKPKLTPSQKSVFNYILHSDVLEFIERAIEKDLEGIYNLASSKNITLKEVAAMCKKKVIFGDFLYTVGNIDNTKAVVYYPALNKTPQKVITTLSKMFT